MKTPDIETAVYLYYAKPELTSDDVKNLFSCGNTTAIKLKNHVRREMAARGVRSWIPSSINTKVAFDLWGIDIVDYEKRLKKLQSLKLEEDQKGA